MNIKDLLPIGGITDDEGAKSTCFVPSDSMNPFSTISLDYNDAPNDWLTKLKHFAANRKDLYETRIRSTKKISDAQKAFPLEDGESFYERLMKNESSDSKTKIQTKIAKQNSYISFSLSDSSNSQSEVSKSYSCWLCP